MAHSEASEEFAFVQQKQNWVVGVEGSGSVSSRASGEFVRTPLGRHMAQARATVRDLRAAITDQAVRATPPPADTDDDGSEGMPEHGNDALAASLRSQADDLEQKVWRGAGTARYPLLLSPHITGDRAVR